jgi:hypothetical protein
MTLSIKSTLSDIAALALVGVVALAPLAAEARGLEGHVKGGNNGIVLQGGTQFSYDERTPTVTTTKRARASRQGVQFKLFGQKRSFNHKAGARKTLSERQFERRNSVDFFHR